MTKAEKITQLLEDRAARFSREAGEAADESTEMVHFTQSGSDYAIPLDSLSETRAISRITFLPAVSDSILGVINVRGRIVSVYTLMQGKNIDITGGFAVIGANQAAHIAIWADSIVGTISVSRGEIKNKPVSLEDKDYITGVGSDGMIYIDLEKIMTSSLYMA